MEDMCGKISAVGRDQEEKHFKRRELDGINYLTCKIDEIGKTEHPAQMDIYETKREAANLVVPAEFGPYKCQKLHSLSLMPPVTDDEFRKGGPLPISFRSIEDDIGEEDLVCTLKRLKKLACNRVKTKYPVGVSRAELEGHNFIVFRVEQLCGRNDLSLENVALVMQEAEFFGVSITIIVDMCKEDQILKPPEQVNEKVEVDSTEPIFLDPFGPMNDLDGE